MSVRRGRGLLQLPFGTMGAPSPCVHIPFWSKTAENGPQLKPQICMMEGASVVGRGVVQLFGHDPFTDQGADTNTRMVRGMKEGVGGWRMGELGGAVGGHIKGSGRGKGLKLQPSSNGDHIFRMSAYDDELKIGCGSKRVRFVP